MTVHYSLNEDDFAYLTQYSVRRQQRTNWIPIALRFVPIIIAIGITMSIGGGFHDPLFFVPLAIVLVAMLAVFAFRFRSTPGIWKRYVQRQYQGTRGLLGERIVQISPEGISQRTQYVESKAQWPSIADIVNEQNYIMVLHTKVGMVLGYYVPKHAFATPELAERFYQTAVAYRNGQTPPEGPADDGGGAVWPPPPRIEKQ